MHRLLPLTLLLSTPALAQSFTFQAPCMPGGSITVDLSEARLIGGSSTASEWSIPPVVTSDGTLAHLSVQKTGGTDVVTIRDSLALDEINIQVAGPAGTVADLNVPDSIVFEDLFAAGFSTPDTNCNLSAIQTSPTLPVAHAFTFEAACMPDPPLVIDVSQAALLEVSDSAATWSIPPVVTSDGTFNYVTVQPGVYDVLTFWDDLDVNELQVQLVGVAGPLTSLSIPRTIEFADFDIASV